MKNIIHISDLHLSSNPNYGFHYEESIKLINCLINDIKLMEKEEKIKFDTVFFTGDLVFSGTTQEFDIFDIHVRKKIIDELSISPSEFHILPGNHDISRKDINLFEKSNRSIDSDFLEKLFDAVNNGSEPWNRLNNYKKYENSLNENNYLTSENLLKTKKISNDLYLLFINSAWLCMDDKDKEMLFITKKQIERATAKIPNSAKIILLTHHPLDWLNQNDRVQFSSFIEKRVGLMFFGHMHEFKQIRESNFNEDITIFLQAGTLDYREDVSGYSCVILNNKNDISDGKVIYRKFNKSNFTYNYWSDYGQNGIFDFSTENSLTFDSDKFSEISSKILIQVDKDHLINIGYSDDKKKSLMKFYSEPNFHPVEMMPHLESKITNTEQINENNESIIIVGGAYSGKTSVLKYLFTKSLEKQVNRDFSRFSFYYDCKGKKPKSKNKVLQEIISQYFAAELNTSFEEKIKRMLCNGYAIIYFDNIDHSSFEANEHVFNFIKEYSKCKYVFSIDQINTHGINDRLTSINLSNYSFTSLGQLKRKNVRDIVSKWDESYLSTHKNLLFREINKLVENSQLPHNYFIYSMLLTIYELKSEIQGILTEADIIENFIEILLKKHCINKEKSQPQYKELMHFLGFLAKNYYEEETSSLSKNQITKIALNFNDQTLYSFDVNGYIDPLISSGLLKKDGEDYYFSQPCFIYYSLAYFMDHDHALKEKILNISNLIKCDKIIEYYSARNASKFDTIEIIDRHLEIKKQDISTLMFDLHKVDVNKMTDFDINDTPILNSVSKKAERFLAEIEEVRADRDVIDDEMDAISPLENRSESHKQIFISKKEQDTDDKLKEFMQILSLFSRVFRNIELSMDKEKLMSVFSRIIENYMFIMKSAILTTDVNIVIPMLEKKLKDISSQGEQLTDDDINDFILAIKNILPLVRSAMPNYIQTLISQDLMSKKPRMETILNLSIKDENEPLSRAMLYYVLMDNNDSNIRHCVGELMKIKSNLIYDSLFIKLNQMINTYYQLGSDEHRFLKNSIQTLISKGRVKLTKSVIESLAKLN
ncbi:metallophosphoesterase [Pectobacterium brasiliense]|uniref:metallophosphoesterase n=1 Tax=Pectobacterium brasiliense TaxID=180957 RepID=UPI00090779A6|nr:metallophosphoesterase [Pectobacterium brasiliense]